MDKKSQVHTFTCRGFNEKNNEAELVNLDYAKQFRFPVVIAFCDVKLSIGHDYRGYISGENPMELRFVLSSDLPPS